MFFRYCPVLFPLAVLPRRVLAIPLSYTAAVTENTHTPLIVISISLISVVAVFLAIKLVYMKHRRIGTIHGPSPGDVRSIPTGSDLSLGSRNKQGNKHRGLLVGCLGSPAWETSLTSKLDGSWRREQRRRSLFAYQLHLSSTTRSTRSTSTRSRSKNHSQSSRLTKSTTLTSCSGDAVQFALPSSSGPSRIPIAHGGSTSRSLRSVERNVSTNRHPRYGDFGESGGMRLPGGSLSNVGRRASPSSIRLVDGPTHSNQVEYAFLSGRPPSAIVVSPFMGTRDSIQLSRCSLKSHRRPVPPLPTLPLFLPFHLPKGPETRSPRASEHLPPLRFSPLASVAKVLYSQDVEKKAPSGRVADSDEGKNAICSRSPCMASTSFAPSAAQHANNTGSLASSCVAQETLPLRPIRKANMKSNHTRSRSCKGLAISSRTTLLDDEDAAAMSPLLLEHKKCSESESVPTGVLRTPSSSSRVSSKKPLKSCLRQTCVGSMPPISSPEPTFTPSMSETSTRTFTVGSTWSTSDQASLRKPISDVDIGMLRLDRFRWNDEIKELKVQSSHIKDSVALVLIWE